MVYIVHLYNVRGKQNIDFLEAQFKIILLFVN